MESSRGSFPRDLTQEPSPSIPKSFPKELIPKNICELEFLNLTHCIYIFGPQMECEDQYKSFLFCKRDRDIKLFDQIKKWEKSHVQSLPQNLQTMYQQGLNNKLNRLTEEIEQMPANFWYVNQRHRYMADIDQLRWRIFYLINKMSYDINQPPEYIKIKPFRFVRPYDYCHKTCAKGRWVGKNILLAMSDEFRAYSKEYYEQAILNGKLQINHKKVGLDYNIRDGDVIEHYVRRVEPPILDIPIPIVFEDNNFLVVDKPPSMIVHTGGGYHFNCIAALLFFEHNQHDLHVLHRLDRLTSGLLIFSKNKALAQEFHEANGKNTIEKTYFARVHGDFPENITENARPQYCKSMKDAIFGACAPEDQKLMCAKACKTLFKKIWYDEKTDSSLIECSPVTGKTHQIRVHLSDLGYPIWNDVGYGGKFVGNKILQKHFQGLNDQVIRQNEIYEEEKKKKIKLNNQEGVDIVQDIPKENQDILENCIAGKEEWDYHKHPLEICLHSYKYKFKNQIFESLKPYWYEK